MIIIVYEYLETNLSTKQYKKKKPHKIVNVFLKEQIKLRRVIVFTNTIQHRHK